MRKLKSKEYTRIITLIWSFITVLIIGAFIWEVMHKDASPVVEPEPQVSAEVKSVESEVSIGSEVIVEPEVTYTEDELFYMAATIYNEAGSDSCSDDTRRLVGYVVLNRVNSSRFPNTIKGVLEQKRQYGTFYRTGIKFADRHTSTGEKNAVDRAYRIAREVLEAEEIPIPSSVVFQAEFKQGSSIYKYQDGIYFCHS